MNVALLLLASLTAVSGFPSVPSAWRTGILVEDAGTGETLFERNATDYFRPASTIKLVTTLLAMKDLGPSYIYETRILADTLAGNIYAMGAGAPLIDAELVRIAALEAAASLDPDKEWNVYWDTSAFLEESHCPGWDESDWSRTYCPPVEALSVGDNVVQLLVSTVGDTMRIYNYPPLPDLELVNGLTVGTVESVKATVEGWETGRPFISLQGTVPPDTLLVLYKPFPGPPAEFAGMLAGELENAGIRINAVRPGSAGNAADSLPQISVIRSEPLFVLLASMNKWSRNMVAEMVLRTVSLELGAVPASTAAGCDAAGRMLRELTPGPDDFRLADGSGLSRYNSLAPAHLAAVLREGANSLEWGVEFLATLPVNGVDGTLKNRMRNLPPGAFRGKTGSLGDTSAVAGLLVTRSGRKLVVVIMMEFPRGRIFTARALQDRMISWFRENY